MYVGHLLCVMCMRVCDQVQELESELAQEKLRSLEVRASGEFVLCVYYW